MNPADQGKAAEAYPPPPPPAYSQTQYGMQPGASYSQHGHTTVVVTQPPAYVQAGYYHFTESPATVVCQHCSQTVTTTTTYNIGSSAWIICFILCVVGLWLGCCLIPFCITGCKDVVHTCPNCKGVIGRFNRLS